MPPFLNMIADTLFHHTTTREDEDESRQGLLTVGSHEVSKFSSKEIIPSGIRMKRTRASSHFGLHSSSSSGHHHHHHPYKLKPNKRSASGRDLNTGEKGSGKITMKEKTPLELQLEIVKTVSQMVEQKVASCTAADGEVDQCFAGRLSITIEKYVERLVHYINLIDKDVDGPDSTGIRCAIIALIYLCKTNVRMTNDTVYKYFSSAFFLAFKYNDDIPVASSYLAQVGGFTMKDVNKSEAAMFKLLKWNCETSIEEFISKKVEIGALQLQSQTKAAASA